MNSNNGESRTFTSRCITVMSRISSSLAGQFRAAGIVSKERTANRSRRISSHTGREIRLPAGYYTASGLKDQAATLGFCVTDAWIMKEWFFGQGPERRRKCRYLIFVTFEAVRVPKGQSGRNLKHLDKYIEQALGVADFVAFLGRARQSGGGRRHGFRAAQNIQRRRARPGQSA